MDGCTKPLIPLALFLLLLPCGCTDNETSGIPEKAAPETRLGLNFDDQATGTIAGKVVWQGVMPQVPPFRVFAISTCPDLDETPRHNPHKPRIDSQTQGIEGAVVFLRKVEPSKSRPWHHGKVRVEQRNREIVIRQGDSSSSVGFVRTGDVVETISVDPFLHILRVRGAAFFSLPFHDPHRPIIRQLTHNGLVEFSSSVYFFWMRGYLFVDDHPYYTRTDKQGRFQLEKVPAGNYQIVCWLPNWNVIGHSREPELGLISQVDFAPPVTKEFSVQVFSGMTNEAEFTLSERDFTK